MLAAGGSLEVLDARSFSALEEEHLVLSGGRKGRARAQVVRSFSAASRTFSASGLSADRPRLDSAACSSEGGGKSDEGGIENDNKSENKQIDDDATTASLIPAASNASAMSAMRTSTLSVMPPQPLPTQRRKIVVLGDGAVGKTCLLSLYSTGTYPNGYIPTVFNNVLVNLDIGSQIIELAVWDTAGQDDYARLRPLAYPDTDTFMLCFAIDNIESFKNAQTKWLQEIRHYCPRTPVILIGLKGDLRHDPSVRDSCISYSQAESLVEQGTVDKYRECSALTGAGILDAVDAAARLSVTPRRRTKRHANCTIL